MYSERKIDETFEERKENFSRPENNTNIKQKNLEEWSSCHVCGASLKSTNLSKHLEKVHSSVSKGKKPNKEQRFEKQSMDEKKTKENKDISVVERRKKKVEMSREKKTKIINVAIFILVVFAIILAASISGIWGDESSTGRRIYENNLDDKNPEIPENHKPKIFITNPNEGSVVKDMIMIRGNVVDEDGDEEIDKVEIKVEDDNWEIVDRTTDWSHEIDTTYYDDASYTIFARAYDGIEYSDISTIELVFDNVEAPGNNRPTVNITDPDDGSEVNGTITIKGISEDQNGDEEIEKVEIKVGGDENWEIADGKTDWTYDIDTSIYDEGKNKIYVKVYDGNDYSEISNIELIFDNEDDEIIIPISDVDDGEIHYYEEEDTKFYVHKNPNGNFKARISLCGSCDGNTFTLKDDGEIIECDVCNTQWDSETYEDICTSCQGSPPPEYLEHVIEEENIIIKKSDLK